MKRAMAVGPALVVFSTGAHPPTGPESKRANQFARQRATHRKQKGCSEREVPHEVDPGASHPFGCGLYGSTTGTPRKTIASRRFFHLLVFPAPRKSLQ